MTAVTATSHVGMLLFTGGEMRATVVSPVCTVACFTSGRVEAETVRPAGGKSIVAASLLPVTTVVSPDA